MGGDFVEFAAFLVQADPPALAVRVVVLDLHAEDGRDAGEAVDHDRDQGPVAKADGRAVIRPSRFLAVPIS